MSPSPIPFMTAAPVSSSADIYQVQAQPRLVLLKLIEDRATARMKEITPDLVATQEAAQAVGYGVDQVERKRYETVYNEYSALVNVLAQVQIDRIMVVNKWLPNAAADARLGKLKAFPTLDPDLAEYAATISLA